MTIEVSAIKLESHLAALAPLSIDHANALNVAGQDGKIWAWCVEPPFTDLDETKRWIQYYKQLELLGERIPFAIIDKESQLPIGCICYSDINLSNKSIAIDHSWLAPKFWEQTHFAEAHLLLVQHAIDKLGVIRVEFTVDTRNKQEQSTVESIGATLEGTLRANRVEDGFRRNNTMIYSILDDEWPSIKENCAELLSSQ